MIAAQIEDVPDLIRDDKSNVLVSAGGRDRGPLVGKRVVHETELSEIQYESDKRPHPVARVVDPLRELYRNDSISEELFLSGIRFQDDFDRARLSSPSASRLDGLPASGRIASDGGRTESIIAARTAVYEAFKSVGGIDSTGGKVLWQVVGLRKTMSELVRADIPKPDEDAKFAVRKLTYTRDMYKGALIVALETIGKHYEGLGYKRRRDTR